MRSLDTLLNKISRKHPHFGIPHLMNYIVIGSVVVFLLDMFSQNYCTQLLAFSPYYILHGQVWRLISFVFIPMNSSNVFFLAISLYFYWMIGSTLEREWGTAKFTVFYLLGVILNALLGFLVGSATMEYVNLSLFFSYATLYPNAQFLLFFILPIKAKWLAWFDAALFAFSIVNYLVHGHFLFALIPLIAILNYFIFFSDHFVRLFHRAKYKTDPKTIQFKKAQKEVQKRAKETKGYMHKCAVCGITDADDPNMEFRYCSKCKGYYCYCMKHINSHVHIQ